MRITFTGIPSGAWFGAAAEGLASAEADVCRLGGGLQVRAEQRSWGRGIASGVGQGDLQGAAVVNGRIQGDLEGAVRVDRGRALARRDGDRDATGSQREAAAARGVVGEDIEHGRCAGGEQFVVVVFVGPSDDPPPGEYPPPGGGCHSTPPPPPVTVRV